jgi:hypothetical protein
MKENAPKKITPYHPEWAKPGCTVVKEWTREIRSGSAVGIGTFCEYKNKNGKLVECMKWVAWQ